MGAGAIAGRTPGDRFNIECQLTAENVIPRSIPGFTRCIRFYRIELPTVSVILPNLISGCTLVVVPELLFRVSP